MTVTATNGTGVGENSAVAELVPYPVTLLSSSNLAAWCDASDSSRVLAAGGSPATSGQSVATVNDRSGKGLSVTQATAASQATLSTMNGRAALASSAATAYASSGTGTFRTIFSAAQCTSGSFGYIVSSKRTAPSGAALFTSQAASDQTGKTLSLSSSFSSGTRGLVGRIGEVLVSNRVFTAAGNRTVEEYLARTWSVTISPSAPSISSVPNRPPGS